MPSADLTHLLDLAETQWATLSELVCALKTPLDQPLETVKRIIDAYALESARPARIIFTDGTGHLLKNTNDAAENRTLTNILSYQLQSRQEQLHAPDSERNLCNGTIVEFTIPALHSWLIRCQLADVADDVFGQWMRVSYPTLKKHNLLMADANDAAHSKQASVNPTSLALDQDELRDLTGKKRGFAQHRVLQAMRIPTKIRADGAVIVLRHDLQASSNRKVKPKVQPNFDALG